MSCSISVWILIVNTLLGFRLYWNLSLHPCEMKTYHVTKFPNNLFSNFKAIQTWHKIRKTWQHKNPLYDIRYNLSCEKIFKVFLVTTSISKKTQDCFIFHAIVLLLKCLPIIINVEWNVSTLKKGLYFKCQMYVWWKAWPIFQN